jgi:hypothetical protein
MTAKPTPFPRSTPESQGIRSSASHDVVAAD